MTERFHRMQAAGISLAVDLAIGHIRDFTVEMAGRKLTPLHTAPWVNDPKVTDDPAIPPHLKYISGDFFCAPFGSADLEPGTPGHGWPANSEWLVVEEGRKGDAFTTRFELKKKVLGATLTKEFTLRDGHPFLYERHVFTGGDGAVSAAGHAMTHFAGEGRLSFSPKAFGYLPASTQETDPARGRSLFATDVRFTDLSKLPLASGKTVDLHRYPVARRHEDLAVLVEAPGASLGWAAAVRSDSADMMLSLKNPADFPFTYLWFSNGGRFYAPWNGRHKGVLGIEEGRAYSSAGHAASIAPNPFSEEGFPTSLTLSPDGSVAVRHVIGGLPLPEGWSRVETIAPGDGYLRIAGDSPHAAHVPFDMTFLA
jgi:hypothetical protein